MSNYVNNVNVGGSMYTLGPLASTASGGIIDNVSGSYSSNNNCIIHTNLNASSVSTINDTLMLNAGVYAGNGAVIDSTCIIGGYMSFGDYSWCTLDTFINCNCSNGTFFPDQGGNTFIGLSCNSNPVSESLLLSGINNTVMGYSSSYTGFIGLHATATKTISLYSYYGTDTGIIFPSGVAGLYHITMFAPTIRGSMYFTMLDGSLNTSELYMHNSYYYSNSDYTSSQGIGISFSNYWYGSGGSTLYVSAAYSVEAPLQITISYDVLPYTGGSGSSSDSSSY